MSARKKIPAMTKPLLTLLAGLLLLTSCATQKFQEEFQLRYPFDGSPVANQKFKIIRQDGSVIRGRTDAEGRTGVVKTSSPEPITLILEGDCVEDDCKNE